jgi:hypothetical protein
MRSLAGSFVFLRRTHVGRVHIPRSAATGAGAELAIEAADATD